MSSMEDMCVVCAEPLLWAGLGPCGHKEVCARCVARMRFVLKDVRCALCQQESPRVLFTRYMGDYTQRVSPEFFESLKDKVATGEMYELPAVDGFFDDRNNYQEIEKLCSYTHPIIPQNEPHEFANVQQLKNYVEKGFSRQFCNICLQSRKVFICEQLVYTKQELDRHMKTGDETGVLAESGFKGHPLCRFCRTRFYGSEDLYKHMEASHEHCFICRRAQPEKYVYFRHYGELEEHFKKDHHLCPHPSCLEKKFVVFVGEAELKRHFAQEHGDELKMSRAQRREALTLPIQFQYRSGNDDGHDGGTFAERPGVVIGGGNNVGSRVARRRGGRQEPQLAAALQASMDTLVTDAERAAGGRGDADGDNPASLTFSASDFPSVSSSTATTGITAGRWAGGGAGTGGSLNPEEFPSLPTMSRADKRRAKKEENARKTLAERLSHAAQQPRVLYRATPDGRPNLQSSDFPSLQPASTSRALTPPSARDSPAPAPMRPISSAPDLDFPSTSSTSTTIPQSRPAPPGFARSSSYNNVINAPSNATNTIANNVASKLPASLDDFPTLVSTSGRPKGPAVGGNNKKAGGDKAEEAAANQEAAAAATPSGGVSSTLKAANKALIEKVKQKLSEAEFPEFRKRSGDFMKGELSAEVYHRVIVDLGLLSLAADMVALCPDADLRAKLMAAHKEHLAVVAAAEQVGANVSNSWIPPEAALAAASEAERFTSWACAACTLINAPQATHCEVCGLRKDSKPPPQPTQPTPTPSRPAISAWQPSSSTSTEPTITARIQKNNARTESNAAHAANGTLAGQNSTTAQNSIARVDSVSEDFPALVTLASNNGAPGQGQGPGPGLMEPADSGLAEEPSGGDKKKKKNKQADKKKSLASFLQADKPTPAGWGNAPSPAVKASGALGGDSYASSSVAGSSKKGAAGGAGGAGGQANGTAPRGQWARNGGSKLAKSIGAINDAWGR